MTTILVTDDSTAQRELIAGLLVDNGFSVITAIDGEQALEKVQETLFDLIILDVVMPKLNGFQTCRKLKEDPKTQNIPVILCSTKNTDVDRYWAKKQGANEYIVKPFSPNELIEKVQQLLGQA
ncbi:response regulator receiver protein [Rippkaea orientalis PCC 8801]|uniref:Response regulator receiver protein n=1 Tax=Rippkaea orientalis (strain PCC 8801 / RF-1) TaxID=41431 RepID=B7K3F8_RIPO1|nr:response regulator [Rippkaea orientalis]ACK65300.1 response regulator receiver protein [Rippkaea orientalis PCC 8801]